MSDSLISTSLVALSSQTKILTQCLLGKIPLPAFLQEYGPLLLALASGAALGSAVQRFLSQHSIDRDLIQWAMFYIMRTVKKNPETLQRLREIPNFAEDLALEALQMANLQIVPGNMEIGLKRKRWIGYANTDILYQKPTLAHEREAKNTSRVNRITDRPPPAEKPIPSPHSASFIDTNVATSMRNGNWPLNTLRPLPKSVNQIQNFPFGNPNAAASVPTSTAPSNRATRPVYPLIDHMPEHLQTELFINTTRMNANSFPTAAQVEPQYHYLGELSVEARRQLYGYNDSTPLFVKETNTFSNTLGGVGQSLPGTASPNASTSNASSPATSITEVGSTKLPVAAATGQPEHREGYGFYYEDFSSSDEEAEKPRKKQRTVPPQQSSPLKKVSRRPWVDTSLRTSNARKAFEKHSPSVKRSHPKPFKAGVLCKRPKNTESQGTVLSPIKEEKTSSESPQLGNPESRANKSRSSDGKMVSPKKGKKAKCATVEEEENGVHPASLFQEQRTQELLGREQQCIQEMNECLHNLIATKPRGSKCPGRVEQ